ncbi:unnamed protein product, partial [Discosporangium mesarthrocarpum]
MDGNLHDFLDREMPARAGGVSPTFAALVLSPCARSPVKKKQARRRRSYSTEANLASEVASRAAGSPPLGRSVSHGQDKARGAFMDPEHLAAVAVDSAWRRWPGAPPLNNAVNAT